MGGKVIAHVPLEYVSPPYGKGELRSMALPVFVYLDFGHRKLAHLREDFEHGVELEMQYCISTLKADVSARHRIVIYTIILSATQTLALRLSTSEASMNSYFGDRGYVLRLMPCVLLHALRQNGGVCVFSDFDTFFYQGITAGLNAVITEGAIFMASP